ncbi:hypothetical protein PM082_012527 [Marasmius tenuissimus]|nr:hypothetical protein PM082_012527 [Marasmius tenuissimus]
MRFMSDIKSNLFILCHHWIDLIIADLASYGSQPYIELFDFPGWKGGLYYERSGDDSSHTIALARFTDQNKLHFFDDFGYKHPPVECGGGQEGEESRVWGRF